MTTRIRRAANSAALPRRRARSWRDWIDVLTLLAWGTMLLKYWWTGKLNILLHPDYMWLSNTAGVVLLGLGGFKVWQQIRPRRSRRAQAEMRSQPHFNLFPPGWSSALLLGVAVFGLLFTPRPFASQTALQRGVTDTLIGTRSQPQQFGGMSRPEERSLIGWIRTLNVYPEPDAYAGQPAKVQGFVIHPPGLSEQYIILSRFIITCCAADTYPVGMPLKLPEGQTRSAYPADMWLEVQGEMMTETLNDERRLVIAAKTLKEIPEPENPYDY